MTCRAVGEVEELGRRLQAGDLQWRPGPALTRPSPPRGTKLSWAGTGRCSRRRGVRHDRQPGQRDREAQLHPVPLIRSAPHQRHRADKDKQRLLPLSRRNDACRPPARIAADPVVWPGSVSAWLCHVGDSGGLARGGPPEPLGTLGNGPTRSAGPRWIRVRATRGGCRWTPTD
jgi:hypothetical protein